MRGTMSQDNAARVLGLWYEEATGDPRGLDAMLNQFFCAVLEQALPDSDVYVTTPEGNYIVHVYRNPMYFEFAMNSQGYCKIVRRVE